jgi:2-dehydropantoate 2-reductase
VRVVVFGAGAIGSLLSARLVHARHDVLLVGRADHIDSLRTRGLRVTGTVVDTVHVRAETSVPPDFVAEAALLTVKAFDLPTAANLLGLQIPTPVPTLLPQNGLGIEPPVQTALLSAGWTDPERWIVRAVNSVPATLVAPGEVRAAGRGELLLGRPKGPNAPATRELTALLRTTEISVRVVADIDREVWRKAILNAAINPVTALHGVPNGHLREGPLRAESRALLDEAIGVARAVGLEFREAELVGDLDKILKATAENRSSMLQDLDRGRRTEIQAISGEILRLGTARGLELPATRRVVEAVRARSPGGPSTRSAS